MKKRGFLKVVVVLSCLALFGCGGSEKIIVKNGKLGSSYTCSGDGNLMECTLSSSASSIDLADLVSSLSGESVKTSTVMWIQAWGGDGITKDSTRSGAGGFAQTVTTVDDFQDSFGATTLYYDLGGKGSQTGSHGGSGGASTIVTTNPGTSSARPFSSTDIVLIAGGGGGLGGGGGNDGRTSAGGGTGGTAIATETNKNCGENTVAHCAAGGDGDGTTKVTTTANGGKGGNKGHGGSGGDSDAKSGTDGFGGEGGGPGGHGDLTGWVNDTPTVADGLGNGGEGRQQEKSCQAFSESKAQGGGGGGGYGGGGGTVHYHQDDGCDLLAGGGGGGGSYAFASTQIDSKASSKNPGNPSGDSPSDGFVRIVFNPNATIARK